MCTKKESWILFKFVRQVRNKASRKKIGKKQSEQGFPGDDENLAGT